jgi:ABC-type taurine transport system substrate-binding protein
MQQAIDLGLELEVLLVQAGTLGKSEFVLVREGVGLSKVTSR